MERSDPRFRLEQGFDGLYGLELIELGDEAARARVPVRAELKRPDGTVHGGVYAAIAEGLATAATAMAVHGDGRQPTALSNQTSFLRPISGGVIHAGARARRRGRGTWVWDVEMLDDEGQLCALTRMTVAVRDGAKSSPA